MNANENLGTKCCAPAPIAETLPLISAQTTEMLEDTEAILERVLDIIEAKNEGRPNAGGKSTVSGTACQTYGYGRLG